MVIAVILSGLLIFSLIKKLIKIAIYVSAVAIIYLGYLYFTGEPMDTVIDEFNKATQHVKDGIYKIVPEKDEK